jgi:hypothetical protein
MRLQKLILPIFIIILLTNIGYAEENQTDYGANVEIAIGTQGNMTSTIVQVADGDINSDIYCMGRTCNTNLFGGNLILPQNISQTYNVYTTQQITQTGGGGMSIYGLASQLYYSMGDYFGGKKSGNDAYDLWSLLDYAFVSHQEAANLYNHVDYLAQEVDRLTAENNMLRAYLNITLNPKMLECQIALATARRTGQSVTTEHGMIAEPNSLDSSCITISEVRSVQSQIPNVSGSYSTSRNGP